ncbi:MAG: hypothetical protein PHT55_08795 [Spirochaetales bacterium]|nr:hypothetical protein [Spirochaetales bacterium]
MDKCAARKNASNFTHPGILFFLVILSLFLPGCAAAENKTAAEQTEQADKKTSVVSAPSALPGSRPMITDEIEPYSGEKRTLVVYFSQGEAGRWVAEDLMWIFGADIEAIEEEKDRRTNFFSFMYAGFQSSFKIASKIEKSQLDPASYDRVFVITPVWAWNLSPPVRAWLKAHKGSIAKAAFITVSGDTKPDKVVAAMAKASGTTPTTSAGFTEYHFQPQNRASYLEVLRAVVDPMR